MTDWLGDQFTQSEVDEDSLAEVRTVYDVFGFDIEVDDAVLVHQ